jgi:hypothetical protein
VTGRIRPVAVSNFRTPKASPERKPTARSIVSCITLQEDITIGHPGSGLEMG